MKNMILFSLTFTFMTIISNMTKARMQEDHFELQYRSNHDIWNSLKPTHKLAPKNVKISNPVIVLCDIICFLSSDRAFDVQLFNVLSQHRNIRQL